MPDDSSLDGFQRELFEALFKAMANAIAYGLPAQFDRIHEPEPVPVTIYPGATPGPDMDVLDRPGKYCFPPIAATVVAGSRLLLGLLEHEVIR